eukprot:gene20173-22148_t
MKNAIVLRSASSCKKADKKQLSCIFSKCDADFTIAGLFTLHDSTSSNEKNCIRGKVNMKSLNRVITMIYAVSEINKNPSLLPGISLALDIRDICTSIDVAIRNFLTLDFVGNAYATQGGWSRPHGTIPGPTFAVVGTGPTMIANSLSTLSNLFNVPVISFTATSTLLGNKDRFKTFFRTVPSDSLLAEMIVDLLQKFEWKLVAVIHSETEYGMAAFHEFVSKLKKAQKITTDSNASICLAYHAKLTRNDSVITSILANSAFDKIGIVVVFAHSYDTIRLMSMAQTFGTSNKIWILPDMSINTKLFCSDSWKSFFGKIITIGFETSADPVDSEFIINNILKHKQEISRKLSPSQIKKIHLEIESNFTTKDSNLAYVVDAVTAAAHALHIALKCDAKSCQPAASFKQENLLRSLYEVNFTSQLGHQVFFNKNGDSGGNYVLHVLRTARNNKCYFDMIGKWRSNGFGEGEFIELHNSNTIKQIPNSACKQCADGWGRLPVRNGLCCWQCKQCDGDEYKSNATNMCEKCPNDSYPHSTRSKCLKLEQRHTSLTRDALGIAILCLSTGGLFLVFLILCVLYRHRNTHLVRASSKELTALLLLGIAFGFSMPLFGVIAQSTLTCRLYFYVNGLSYSLMIGSLFVKVNRISRIFRKDVLRTGQPKFMTVKWQMLFMSIIVILEMSMMSLMIFATNDQVRHIQVRNKHHIDSLCHTNFHALLALLLFNGVFVLLCTYQAFLSRKLPDGYSESQSVFVVMILIALQNLTCSVTLSYGGGDFNPVMVSIPHYLNAFIITAVLLGFKLYIILFKPDRNKMPDPHGTLGTFASVKRKRKHTVSQEAQQPKTTGDEPAAIIIRNIGIKNSSFEPN